MQTTKRQAAILATLASVLTAAIFLLDIETPLGFATPVLYVIPLLLGFWFQNARFAIAIASIATLLTIGMYLLEPSNPQISFWYPLFNRTAALLAIWITAGGIALFKRVERKSLAGEARLRDIEYALDQSAIVAATDERGRITHVNDMFCKISEYSREELLGQDHRIINSGYHSKEYIRALWETITAGRIWRGEIRNRAKGGASYWVDTTIIPFLDASGKPYQYLAIRSDITQRKNAEAALLEQNALARLGEMAAVVAHEVKNPLAGIGGAIQIIGSRLPEGSSDRPIIQEILDRIASLNETVEDLLLYARPKPPKIQAIKIRPVLESSADLLARDPAFGRVKVLIQGEDCGLKADPVLLQQVVLNLLLNASQAMGGKGTIQVKTTLSEGMAHLAVSDTGPGIAPAIREKIFEPFFTTKHRGTGLGLAIAKRVLELHGGAISASCPAGGGTCMTITLPNAGPVQKTTQ